jgi:hypothetical protein
MGLWNHLGASRAGFDGILGRLRAVAEDPEGDDNQDRDDDALGLPDERRRRRPLDDDDARAASRRTVPPASNALRRAERHPLVARCRALAAEDSARLRGEAREIDRRLRGEREGVS